MQRRCPLCARSGLMHHSNQQSHSITRRRQKRCSRGALQFDPSVMALAVAAALGGIVAVGSSRSTAKEARHELTAAEAKRTVLIGQIGLRLVPGLAAWDCKALRPLGISRILPGAGETRATRSGRSQRPVRQLRRRKHQSSAVAGRHPCRGVPAD
jgi:hypothetical protein